MIFMVMEQEREARHLSPFDEPVAAVSVYRHSRAVHRRRLARRAGDTAPASVDAKLRRHAVRRASVFHDRPLLYAHGHAKPGARLLCVDLLVTPPLFDA